MSDTLLAASGADPRVGMMLQDKYKIVRKLGEGGMGAVYEGEHTLIRRRVAIKCLHAHYASSPEIVARFHREALAATSIGHPNIIECTDMGRFPDGAFFMVLEFLDGRDWSHVLTETGPQPLGRVVHIMSQVCDALTAAHDKGVVHRDLKPENIFLIKRGGDPDFVKVLDFGISKIKGNEGEGDARSKGLTRTGMAMGTPYYMAPEQAQGKRDIDHRADIYALGVILFQALTGQYPFDDESYPMLVVKICTQDPPPIEQFRPDLPPGIVQLVGSMLAKKPEHRPQTCQDVKAALLPYAAQNAAPVVAADAPRTASTGAFDGPGTSTGPMAAAARANTPPTRPGTAPTPFAAADDGPVARASLTEARSGGSRLGLWIGLGGGGLALAALAVVGIVVIGNNGGSTTPTAAVATPPAVPAPPVPTPPPVTPTPEIAAPTPPAPVAPVATVRVQIETTPAEAELFLDDDPIPNPFDGDLPQTREPRTLRAQYAGYTTKVQDLVLSVSQRVRITLHRGRGTEDTSTRHARTATAERPAGGGSTSTSPATSPSTAQETGTRSGGTAPTPPVQVTIETPRAPDPPPSTGGGGGGATEEQPATSGSGSRCPGGLMDPFGRCRRTQ